MVDAKVRELLLVRQGLFVVPAGNDRQPDSLLQALELRLAALGYVISSRLRARLATLPEDALGKAHLALVRPLAAAIGADLKHIPLFRKFPQGVPRDTFDLYVKKVLVHFFQAEDQPCLFCCRVGTTHVLRPCAHVVCEKCWDGASYSACPCCEHRVDPASPFFRPSPDTDEPGRQPVRWKLIDLCDDPDAAARALLVSLCQRKQALSPADRDALKTLCSGYAAQVPAWLPDEIPVRENVAAILGVLLGAGALADVAPLLTARLKTATDVLRTIAALSGADPALQRETVIKQVEVPVADPAGAPGSSRWFGRIARIFGLGQKPAATASGKGAKAPAAPEVRRVQVSIQVRRFKVARLSRPLRRVLLGVLEGFAFESLVEDLARHAPYWVWVGEFLHPFEHAARFPKTALSFAVLRGTPIGEGPAEDALRRAVRAVPGLAALEARPDGTYAYRNFHARLERAAVQRDARRFAQILGERPGELARRLDHGLRIALVAGQPADALTAAFAARIGAMGTPVLLTLSALLPRRSAPESAQAPVRIFWPKGQVAKGVSLPDTRPPLPAEVTAPIVRAIHAELLRRFADKPAFPEAIVDAALQRIVVPFNERTASRSAVQLPRGSQLPLPAGEQEFLRLFLHWCEPEGTGKTTDIDLSAGFYDADWRYVATCSYYSLRMLAKSGGLVAQSSGDLRSAPPPDGASEFVDVHRPHALADKIRYAVMVVNNYSGLPFSQLTRGFAGIMLRDRAGGPHFDPGAALLKFDLQGENGVYLPMVVDLEAGQLHWLDVYNRGQFEMNNVATSSAAIQKLCPELIGYFGSGVRPSMYDLALLHAAARCRAVCVRAADGETWRFERRAGEDAAAFHARIVSADVDAVTPAYGSPAAPVLAALYRGDVQLAEGSSCYVLLREGQTAVLSASDLLS